MPQSSYSDRQMGRVCNHTMKSIAAVVVAFAACYVACTGANYADLNARRAQLKALTQEEWEFELQSHPERATGFGENRYNDRISDYSADFHDKEVDQNEQFVRRFAAIDVAGFPETEQLNKQLMLRALNDSIEGAQFKAWEMPLDQMNGPHLEYARMVSVMPFNTTQDYDNYLARLRQLPHGFDQITDDMRLGLRDRLMPPAYLLGQVASEVQAVAEKTPEASSFALPLKQFPASVSTADQTRLRSAILGAITDDVLPAYVKLGRFITTDYAPHGRAEYGVWSLPHGDSYYRFLVRHMTTTDLSPEQIHQIGLKQIQETRQQMLAIATKLGYSDLRTFNEHIQHDPALYPKSAQELIDRYQHFVDQMYSKLPELFGRLPKNRLTVGPMEAYRAPYSAPADITLGDSSRPGRVNVNTYDFAHRLLIDAESTAYHEGIPGHHLQTSIAQENPDLPSFRKYAYYNAYAYFDGWAFYAERLGKDIGFDQDPYSDYGRLNNEMWRAVRLVTDTGVHYKHWSRQQMMDLFHENTALSEQTINNEVDRYIAWPTQALVYKIGQMKILELRQKAKKELGSKFDIRGFHDTVVDAGPLPLDVLEQRVDKWISQQNLRSGAHDGSKKGAPGA